MFSFVPDIDSTLSKLEVVLQPIKEDWEQLGISLGVNQSELSLIKSKPGDSTDYMSCLLEKWSVEGGQLQDLEKGLVSIGKKDMISGMLTFKNSRIKESLHNMYLILRLIVNIIDQ